MCMWRSLFSAGLVVLLAACTSPTNQNNADDGKISCDASAHCPWAGYVCVNGQCVAGNQPPPPPVNTHTLGAQGGTVVGEDGVSLKVPAGALSSEVTFSLKRRSASTPTSGFIAISYVYVIEPADTTFAVNPTVIIPYATSQIPEGRKTAEVALYRAAALGNSYTPLAAGTSEVGSATGVTNALGLFVVGLPILPDEVIQPPPEEYIPTLDTQNSLGSEFLRDCSADASLCGQQEPVCTAIDSSGLTKVCTGTCQYKSDCPISNCCTDMLDDDNPQTTLCMPNPDPSTPCDPTIPDNRTCTVNADCPRGGTCIGTRCFPAGGSSNVATGDSCTHVTDCDLNIADNCLHRLPEEGGWIAGDKSNAPTAEYSICAKQCDANGGCGANECCRFAMIESAGVQPIAYCVPNTGSEAAANCAPVVGLYQNCDPLNEPSICDPQVSTRCVFFEYEWGEGRYCSKPCTSANDCGSGNSCCSLSSYGGEKYCIQGAVSCNN